jgi:acyl-CoA reductase-like NAD-dependent aldehyde dehydrogenase
MSTSAPKVQNFINGEFVDSNATNWIPLTNPATGEVIGTACSFQTMAL